MAKRVSRQANTSNLEGEIDQLGYQLYGLSEADVKIVEGENKNSDKRQNGK